MKSVLLTALILFCFFSTNLFSEVVFCDGSLDGLSVKIESKCTLFEGWEDYYHNKETYKDDLSLESKITIFENGKKVVEEGFSCYALYMEDLVFFINEFFNKNLKVQFVNFNEVGANNGEWIDLYGLSEFSPYSKLDYKRIENCTYLKN